MLTSFNLLPKHILLLLSNHVVQICNDISDFQNKAVTTDTSNQLASASRFGWVTLQAHGCMELYLKDRFRRHPGINSSFICFLTRHMADQTSLGLKEAVNALTTRVKKVKETAGGKVTQEMYNKLDAKIKAVINANNLSGRNDLLMWSNKTLCCPGRTRRHLLFPKLLFDKGSSLSYVLQK